MPFNIFSFRASLPESHPRRGRSAPGFRLLVSRGAIAAVWVFLFLAAPAYPSGPVSPRNVLILLTGEHGLPAYDLVLPQIRGVVQEGHPQPLNWYAEYTDTVRFSDFHEEQAVIDDFYDATIGFTSLSVLYRF